MKALVRLVLTGVVIAVLATTASAGLVSGVIPAGSQTNEFTGKLPGTVAGEPIGGWYGASIYLLGASPADITVEWFGGEAFFENEFWWEGDVAPLFTHPGGDNTSGTFLPPSVLKTSISPGLLPFSFLVDGGPDAVANGANPDNSGVEPNFFVSFYDLSDPLSYPGSKDPGGPLAGQFVWIFFDDGGGPNDDNHDDMLIRLSVTEGELAAVPEPGSMLLLGSGLAALWARRRRS